MIGKTNAGGGGSTALNFKVVGGGTAPSNPSENTIWVNTGNAITGWVFSATAPSSPTAGLVWIRTAAASNAAFNALKRGTIMVYPGSAKQYVSGAWVNKTAMTYQNGAWVSWSLILYEPGDVREETTGGYEAKAIRYSDTWGSNTVTAKAPTVTQGADSMVISLQNGLYGENDSGSVLTKNKIDLSAYQKITFECSFVFENQANSVRFYISESNTAYTPVAETIVQGNNVPSSGKVVLTLPSSMSGDCYVGINVLTGAGDKRTNTVTVTRITCE